jgi:hypothetical protein
MAKCEILVWSGVNILYSDQRTAFYIYFKSILLFHFNTEISSYTVYGIKRAKDIFDHFVVFMYFRGAHCTMCTGVYFMRATFGLNI